MKKLFIISLCFIFSIGNIYAYEPSTPLQENLEIGANKINILVQNKGENYRKTFLGIIDDNKLQNIENERNTYILNYLYNYINAIEIISEPLEDICVLYDDFTEAQKNNWVILNDGVMGGLSKGNIFIENNTLTFSGNINTNGGGFTSIRSTLTKNILGNTDYIKLKIKADSRKYKLTFRDSYRTGVSYQADIIPQQSGTFEYINISLSDLTANYFGRNIDTRAFNTSQALELGFIISDGVNGTFQMEIENIEFCEKT